jgi:ammonia channel protein AmtB
VPRGILIYRRRCRKCRVLSLVAVAVASGAIRRVADDSAEAAALHGSCGARGGLKLTLVVAGRTYTGLRALAGIPLCPLLVFGAAVVHVARLAGYAAHVVRAPIRFGDPPE